jgi:hypothetical protein
MIEDFRALADVSRGLEELYFQWAGIILHMRGTFDAHFTSFHLSNCVGIDGMQIAAVTAS